MDYFIIILGRSSITRKAQPKALDTSGGAIITNTSNNTAANSPVHIAGILDHSDSIKFTAYRTNPRAQQILADHHSLILVILV